MKNFVTRNEESHAITEDPETEIAEKKSVGRPRKKVIPNVPSSIKKRWGSSISEPEMKEEKSVGHPRKNVGANILSSTMKNAVGRPRKLKVSLQGDKSSSEDEDNYEESWAKRRHTEFIDNYYKMVKKHNFLNVLNIVNNT